MADTYVLAESVTTTGASFAVDSDASGGVWPYAKLAFGPGGTQTVVGAGANALPVSIGNTIAATIAGSVSVIGGTISAVGTLLGGTVSVAGITSIGTVLGGTVTVNTLLGGTVTAVGGVSSIGTVLGGTITAVGTLLGGTVTAVGGVGGVTSIGTILGGTITAVGGVTSIGSIVAALPAGGNSIGMTQNIPGTTGGLSRARMPLAAGLNLTLIKTGAGQLYFISVQTINALPVYLKVFDVAGTVNVTMGTTACDYQFMSPANATSSLGAGIALAFDPGITHTLGMVMAITGGMAFADNTSLGASVATVAVGYK